MHRRLVAPFVGILLALTLAIAPVSAAPAPSVQVSPVCSLLAGLPLPTSPFFVLVWQRVLDSLGCGRLAP